jgi:hypothetical protein
MLTARPARKATASPYSLRQHEKSPTKVGLFHFSKAKSFRQLI